LIVERASPVILETNASPPRPAANFRRRVQSPPTLVQFRPERFPPNPNRRRIDHEADLPRTLRAWNPQSEQSDSLIGRKLLRTLTNIGTIDGGSAGAGGGAGEPPGLGGAGVSNAKGATIVSLTNVSGWTISGGAGGAGFMGGADGTGVSNAGTITTLTNAGTIQGGDGGAGTPGGPGGKGLLNTGTITTLNNTGTIKNGSAGADAIDSVGSIGTLTKRSDHRHSRTPRRVWRHARQPDLRQCRSRWRRHPEQSGASLWRRDARQRRHLHQHGRHSRRRHAGSVGHLRHELGRGQRGDHGLERRSTRIGGNFGHETIDNFAAGAGPTHDSIRIALGVFGSYAALSSSMSQVGSDVVISLGATDSITLNGVRMSSLVSADFKFG
jgi:hypothetical protein